MKKKRTIVLVVAVIVVLLAANYLWGPDAAPRGQDLVSLSGQKFSKFEKAFDADVDVLRLVLLLSPT
jgi:hypothetical protein